jgi:Holliday junction resolvase
MVDPRAKGARGETQVRDELRKFTGLKWERTPGSGALDPKHNLKGDVYSPNADNVYCIEVKNYEEDHISSKLLTSKSPQLLEWWEQAVRQGIQVNKKPLLIFKFSRSKMFVAFPDMPTTSNYRVLTINDLLFVSTLEDWLNNEKPRFIK